MLWLVNHLNNPLISFRQMHTRRQDFLLVNSNEANVWAKERLMRNCKCGKIWYSLWEIKISKIHVP